MVELGLGTTRYGNPGHAKWPVRALGLDAPNRPARTRAECDGYNRRGARIGETVALPWTYDRMEQPAARTAATRHGAGLGAGLPVR